jgi:hypothetical protein
MDNNTPDTFRILDVEKKGNNGKAITIISGELTNAERRIGNCNVYANGGAHVLELVGSKATPIETLQMFANVKNVEPVLDSCDSRLTSKSCDTEKVRAATDIVKSMIGQQR